MHVCVQTEVLLFNVTFLVPLSSWPVKVPNNLLMELFLIFVDDPYVNDLAAQGIALQTMRSSTVLLNTTA